jgi:hypothetical protein
MASNTVKLGIGLATGMFYHAPTTASFPTYPGEQLSGDWKLVGDITQDGITLTIDKSTESLKNWANVTKRLTVSDHTETIAVPIMETTQEVLEVVLGANHVTSTPATSAHGEVVTASLSNGELPAKEKFLFLMKDGEDMMAIGCTGQIQSMEAITFAPGSAITWNPTITILDDSLVFISDDGQVSS